MEPSQNPEIARDKATRKLPRAQVLLLAVFLVLYPLFQLLLNLFAPQNSLQVESKIAQLYVPTLVLQILILASILMAIIKDGETLASLGIKRKDFSWINLGISIGFMIFALVFLNVLHLALSSLGLPISKDIALILPRTIAERIIWIILAIMTGVSEEICFRGFVISRMGILTRSVWPGVVLGSLAFSIGHSYQGIGGVIVIGTYGLMFALLFLARGSLVPCIIAHALQDILASFTNI